LSSDGFYRDLPSFDDARGVVDPTNFRAAPDDWVVVLTDVRGSTAAIRAGHYKDVNLVGAASITAVLNALPGVDLPYVFGGDGATLLVPAHGVAAVRRALLATQQMSQREFALELRVAAVPVGDVVAAGFAILVGKYAVSPDVSLAMFTGGGLQQAEALVKGPEAARYLFAGDVDGPPDCAGLECRWRPLKSTHGEVMSVLVKVTAPDAQRIYRELIEEIERITGGRELVNPVNGQNLRLTLRPGALVGEHRIHAGRAAGLARAARFVALLLLAVYGWVLVTLRLRAHGVAWGRYPDEVRANTDFWKYDDMLRFVIDVTSEQKRALVERFEARLRAGEIVYGVHCAGEALMTCLVFNRVGNHVHFVDGGGGGYALAAAQLKAQLKESSAKDASG
jgi:hypothetical protein